jgi:hypothetical protein
MIHDPGHIDIVGASGGARLAGGAQPDGPAPQQFILPARLQQPHDAAHGDIIGEGIGAPTRAVAALIAQAQVLPASRLHFPDKLLVAGFKIKRIHTLTAFQNVIQPPDFFKLTDGRFPK